MNKKTYCIGLTGGIGSGKTTVANLFAKLNVPIIDADLISHELTQKDKTTYQLIVTHFGKAILNPDQTLNRKQLRSIIFSSPEEKKWLENTLHPLIRSEMSQRIEKIQAPYCLCVIPLLTESKGIHFINRVLVVDAPTAMQIERAKKRDQATAESIQKIVASQSSQSQRLNLADDILINDGDFASLEDKVMALHQQYLKLAQSA